MPEPLDDFHRTISYIPQTALSGLTPQTHGMHRVEAISAATVSSSGLWMGQTHVSASTASGNHHHGKSETGIYVVSGHPEFVFMDQKDGEWIETRLTTAPGDYIYIPAWVPHREENPASDEEAVVVIARTTQEALVVNVTDLGWVGPAAVGHRERHPHIADG